MEKYKSNFAYKELTKCYWSRDFKEKLDFLNKFLEIDFVGIEYKKFLKCAYKNSNINNRINPDYIEFHNDAMIVNHGISYSRYMDGEKDYDSWIEWYLIDATSIETAMNLFIKYLGNEKLESDEIHSDYDCTGQVFSDSMRFIQVSENRVFVRKRYGRDV